MSGNVFDLDNMIRKRYYVDNKSDLSEINFEQNDQVYVINDNQLYQVQITNNGIVLYKINTRSPAAITYKDTVATTGDLPLMGNTLGDMYIVEQDGHMYIWKSNNSFGTIEDWVDSGPGVDMSKYRTAAEQDLIDANKQNKITATGILKGDGNGGVSAAVAGTDYDTAPNIVSATAAMTPAQAAQTIENLGFPVLGDPYSGVDLTVKFATEIANYTDEWAWIKARIQAGNFSGVHVNDYIPFTVNDKVFRARVAGINVYYGYGDDGYKIGNHIDFISEELWPTAHRMNPVSWNNGLIPIESIATDGTATNFVLTKKMAAIDTIKMGDVNLTGWSYDLENFTVTFEEAPSVGTLTITGIGTEHPWLATEYYLWLNSLAGQVPNSTDNPPATAVNYVDFTTDGVFYYLPQKLKDVIVEKRLFLEKRYSANGKLTTSSNAKSINIGKLWVPTEVEVYGTSVYGKSGYAIAGSACGKYPIFIGKCPQKYTIGNTSITYAHWWLLTPYEGSANNWCYVMDSGGCGFNTTTQTRRVPVCFRIA